MADREVADALLAVALAIKDHTEFRKAADDQRRNDWLIARDEDAELNARNRKEDLERIEQERAEDRDFREKLDTTNWERAVRLREMESTIAAEKMLAAMRREGR